MRQCVCLSAIKVIFLAPFENFCSISTKMKYSIGIRFALRINKIHSCFQSQTEIKLQKKAIPDKRHKVTRFPFLLVLCCMEDQERALLLSPSPARVQLQNDWLANSWRPFQTVSFLPFPGPHSRHFILFPIPEWTQLRWLSLRPQAKPGLYKLWSSYR